MKNCPKKQLHFSYGLPGTDSRRAFTFQRRNASSPKLSVLSILFFPILVNSWKSNTPESSYLSLFACRAMVRRGNPYGLDSVIPLAYALSSEIQTFLLAKRPAEAYPVLPN